ncbi:hypothetical protein AVEN_268726-1 [Araneus ventricosus]|uniref:Uncharacterized protein n=1 Tax=Araneus ventricosus TaxID=182803 RepID=A0A4Y2HSM1_ARAVE|nr:hypothetical protein AVEN_268726-1 [Araneus ventricosus]
MQVQAQVLRNTQFSRHCWIGTVQQTSHSCASVDQASSSSTPTLGREHRDWTMDEWKRVARSDESRFLIHHVDSRVRVRRLPGEQLLPSCTAGHTQAGSGGIMLWETFSWGLWDS